jgi:hypothetical protein
VRKVEEERSEKLKFRFSHRRPRRDKSLKFSLRNLFSTRLSIKVFLQEIKVLKLRLAVDSRRGGGGREKG